jgi:hypothetical protein
VLGRQGAANRCWLRTSSDPAFLISAKSRLGSGDSPAGDTGFIQDDSSVEIIKE